MENDSLQVWAVIPGVGPDEVYAAWLDGDKHAAMTGGSATSAHGVGARFTAWDGYIAGETLELEPGARILQKWRTTQFPPDAPDSLLEILFEDTPDGTHVTIVQTRLPPDQVVSYTTGWIDHYFEPMKRHFGSQTKSAARTTVAGRPSAKKKAAAKSKPKAAAKPKPKKKAAAKPKPKKKAAAKPKPKKKPAAKPKAKKKAAAKPKKKPGKKKPKKKGRSRR